VLLLPSAASHPLQVQVQVQVLTSAASHPLGVVPQAADGSGGVAAAAAS
jgi:hypothetical protein